MSLSTDVVAARAGVTYRQVDHWASKGLIPGMPAGKGTGNARRWDARQAAFVARMARLVHAGMLPAAAAEMVGRGEGTFRLADDLWLTIGRPTCWAGEYLDSLTGDVLQWRGRV